MTVRALVNGVIATSGSKMFKTGKEQVAQNIETRLLWFYGEAFLDSRRGTPWFQTILGKNTGLEREAALKKVILETEGVDKLLSFTLTQEDRTLILTASVLTIYSTEPVTVTTSI